MLIATFKQPPVGEEWRGGWRMGGWMVCWHIHDKGVFRGISVPRRDFNFSWFEGKTEENFGWFATELRIFGKEE